MNSGLLTGLAWRLSQNPARPSLKRTSMGASILGKIPRSPWELRQMKDVAETERLSALWKALLKVEKQR